MNILTAVFGPSVPALKPGEVQEKLKNGKRPFLLDVREREEMREGYISGAQLIPLALIAAYTGRPEGVAAGLFLSLFR